MGFSVIISRALKKSIYNGGGISEFLIINDCTHLLHYIDWEIKLIGGTNAIQVYNIRLWILFYETGFSVFTNISDEQLENKINTHMNMLKHYLTKFIKRDVLFLD